jgi:hypothetical protein
MMRILCNFVVLLYLTSCASNVKDSKDYKYGEYICQNRNGVHWFTPKTGEQCALVECWDTTALCITTR